MKVLSIRQPWAWLIMCGLKDVENRTWKTDYRGEFGVHAGKKFDWDALIVLREMRIPSWMIQSMIAHFGLELADTPEKSKVTAGLGEFGVILGTVRLTDCTKKNTSIWCDDGLYHFCLSKPNPWKDLVPASGKLGFWEYQTRITDDELKKIQNALREIGLETEIV